MKLNFQWSSGKRYLIAGIMIHAYLGGTLLNHHFSNIIDGVYKES